MNNAIKYAAVVAAFAAAAIAFTQNAVWAAVVAVLAGALMGAAIITDKRER